MSLFESTKHCTKRFPCRFRLALMVFAVAIAASIAAVPLISHLAYGQGGRRSREHVRPILVERIGLMIPVRP